jgi:hypothetical protein
MVRSALWLTLVTFACCAGAEHCVPGRQVACACQGGTFGVQVCAGDGSRYDACMCDSGSGTGGFCGSAGCGTAGGSIGGSGDDFFTGGGPPGGGPAGGSAGGQSGGFVDGGGAGGGSTLVECTSTSFLPADLKVFNDDGGLFLGELSGSLVVVDAGSNVIVLAGAGQPSLQLNVDTAGQRADLVLPGQTVELTVKGLLQPVPFAMAASQQIILSRGGELLAFGATLNGLALQVPQLPGIELSDDEALCDFVGTCRQRLHQLRVTLDGGTAVVSSGATVDVAGFRVSLGEFVEKLPSVCDDWSRTRVAGIRLP